jgi:hypothetical protein
MRLRPPPALQLNISLSLAVVAVGTMLAVVVALVVC